MVASAQQTTMRLKEVCAGPGPLLPHKVRKATTTCLSYDRMPLTLESYANIAPTDFGVALQITQSLVCPFGYSLDLFSAMPKRIPYWAYRAIRPSRGVDDTTTAHKQDLCALTCVVRARQVFMLGTNAEDGMSLGKVMRYDIDGSKYLDRTENVFELMSVSRHPYRPIELFWTL
jgi:hypothetical protein